MGRCRGRRGHHSAAVTVQALLQVTQSLSTQELQPNLAPAVINDKSCSFLIYKYLGKWWGVSRVSVQFQPGSLKKKKKKHNKNFQGVLMMHFSLRPAPQPSALSIMQFENKLPLTRTHSQQKMNWWENYLPGETQKLMAWHCM